MGFMMGENWGKQEEGREGELGLAYKIKKTKEMQMIIVE